MKFEEPLLKIYSSRFFCCVCVCLVSVCPLCSCAGLFSRVISLHYFCLCFVLDLVVIFFLLPHFNANRYKKKNTDAKVIRSRQEKKSFKSSIFVVCVCVANTYLYSKRQYGTELLFFQTHFIFCFVCFFSVNEMTSKMNVKKELKNKEQKHIFKNKTTREKKKMNKRRGF